MKLLLKLSKEAIRYRGLYAIAILSTLILTVINLAAPKVLSAMTGIVSEGVDDAGMKRVWDLTLILVVLYLARVAFRFLNNYLAHKAAWYLVGDLRTRTYDKLERMHIGYFHDKQTGDLMSRIVNDTRDFELLYAHMIPETITNIVTFLGVLIVLLTINPKLALITCAPIPLIFLSGIIFSKKVRHPRPRWVSSAESFRTICRVFRRYSPSAGKSMRPVRLTRRISSTSEPC